MNLLFTLSNNLYLKYKEKIFKMAIYFSIIVRYNKKCKLLRLFSKWRNTWVKFENAKLLWKFDE